MSNQFNSNDFGAPPAPPTNAAPVVGSVVPAQGAAAAPPQNTPPVQPYPTQAQPYTPPQNNYGGQQGEKKERQGWVYFKQSQYGNYFEVSFTALADQVCPGLSGFKLQVFPNENKVNTIRASGQYQGAPHVGHAQLRQKQQRRG